MPTAHPIGLIMCDGCWDEYGKPDIVNEKTEAALALVRQVYAAPRGGAGGRLHIVLDDWNLEDEHIYWCHKFEVPLQVVVSPSMFPRPVRWVQCFWEIIE